MISRIVDPTIPLKDLSLLLLGPRQTGKTTLLRNTFPSSKKFDLLDPEIFRDLNKSPLALKELIDPKQKGPVIIDEIQKLPELLDVVHLMIEENKSLRFILTGSSARKLKKQGQNLLGGRAYPLSLHPICSKEIFLSKKEKINVDTLVQLGGLPSVLTSSSPQRVLKAYVGIYLQEEIRAEGFARNLADFSKFLEVTAMANSEQLDFASVARDIQISPRTVNAYYSILQDTLVGYLLEPFRETKTRKAVSKPKFYFFDVGVSNFLSGRESLAKGTPEYGKALEHFVFTELIAFRDYTERKFELFYWRSTSQFEVDFVIRLKSKKLIGIEVKGSHRIDRDDLKGLKALEDDFKLEKKIIVSIEKNTRLIDDKYLVLPIETFCKNLWNNEIF
jgi:predicted AAA+ superfamily ATPase